MKPKLLVSNRFKLIGLLLFLPFLAYGIAVYFYDFGFSFLMPAPKPGAIFSSQTRDYNDELALSGIIISLLLIAFAREKQEDEFINKVRLESLQWAVMINYILLVAAAWLIYGMPFLDVMMYNMLTVLVLFILRFHIKLWSNRYTANHQKI